MNEPMLVGADSLPLNKFCWLEPIIHDTNSSCTESELNKLDGYITLLNPIPVSEAFPVSIENKDNEINNRRPLFWNENVMYILTNAVSKINPAILEIYERYGRELAAKTVFKNDIKFRAVFKNELNQCMKEMFYSQELVVNKLIGNILHVKSPNVSMIECADDAASLLIHFATDELLAEKAILFRVIVLMKRKNIGDLWKNWLRVAANTWQLSEDISYWVETAEQYASSFKNEPEKEQDTLEKWLSESKFSLSQLRGIKNAIKEYEDQEKSKAEGWIGV